MFRYIEKLQKKPEHIKRGIALFITVLLFLVVIFVWLSIAGIPLVEKKESHVSETPSPFIVLKNTFGDLTSGAGDNFKKLKEQFNGGN